MIIPSVHVASSLFIAARAVAAEAWRLFAFGLALSCSAILTGVPR